MIYENRNAVVNLYEDIPIANGLNIAFKSRTSQASYFNARRISQATGAAYLRHNAGSIELEVLTSVVVKSNYISFINPDFDGIPFYGAVTDFEYVNANNIRIYYEIDWWQTFMFDVKYRSSMIDREHLSEIGWNSATSNPYRNDIPELLTEEDLMVGRDLEVPYKRRLGEINTIGKPLLDSGSHPGAPSGSVTAVPSSGYTGLSVQIGRQFNAVSMNFNTTKIVFQVAEFDESKKPGLSEFFPTVRKSGYQNGFGRAYFLAVLDDSTTEDDYDGENAVIELKMQQALDWFDANGLTSQILGIWAVPLWLLQHDAHYIGYDTGVLQRPRTSSEEIKISAPDYSEIEGYGVEIDNPKLRRAPFRYYRVTSPNGEVQMLPLEMFDTQDRALRLYGNFDDTPSITVVPQQFNGHSVDFQRRLVYDTYPQIGYSSDAYLTFLAAKYQESLATATRGSYTVNSSALGRAGAWASQTASAAKGVLTNPNGAVAGLADAGMEGDIYNEAKSAGNLTGSQWGDVARGDVASKPFDQNRGAFIADIYHAGNASGSLGVRLEQDYFDVVLVTLRPELVKMYDEYLNAYGYASRRLGVPRVCSWVLGVGDAPHFVQAEGYEFTYVQTSSLKVFGAFRPACDQISSMFDAGVRMINGEES